MSGLVNSISQLLQWLYNVSSSLGIPNYGLAIIIFTVVVKLAMFPLTAQQVRSMKKMQELQPKVKEIQKKFKDNPQKSQQMVMELYQKEKVNPFSGCLPLLIQMPILFALFSALRTFFDPVQHPAYVNLDHANFFWISNLGSPDPYVLPLLAALFTFLQQKVSMPGGAGQDQTQKTMLYVMPVFMGWISRSFPAGLALYWVIYSVVSALEQMILKRKPRVVKEEAMG